LGHKSILKPKTSLLVLEFNFRIHKKLALEKEDDFLFRNSRFSDSMVLSWNPETNRDLFFGIILRLPTKLDLTDLPEEEKGIEDEFVPENFLLFRGEVEIFLEERHPL